MLQALESTADQVDHLAEIIDEFLTMAEAGVPMSVRSAEGRDTLGVTCDDPVQLRAVRRGGRGVRGSEGAHPDHHVADHQVADLPADGDDLSAEDDGLSVLYGVGLGQASGGKTGLTTRMLATVHKTLGTPMFPWSPE